MRRGRCQFLGVLGGTQAGERHRGGCRGTRTHGECVENAENRDRRTRTGSALASNVPGSPPNTYLPPYSLLLTVIGEIEGIRSRSKKVYCHRWMLIANLNFVTVNRNNDLELVGSGGERVLFVSDVLQKSLALE